MSNGWFSKMDYLVAIEEGDEGVSRRRLKFRPSVARVTNAETGS